MALFSTVDRRTWMDAKFRALSPDAKLLWFYLLTGPETTSLPGVIIAGRAQLAEALEWELERFSIRYAELSDRGMTKADWSARLVWLPRAIRYRAPSNPKVVLGWERVWDNVPECELKSLIFQQLEAHVKSRGEKFIQAWKRYAYRIANGIAYKEKEKEKDSVSSSNEEESSSSPTATRGGYPLEFNAWWSTYPRKVGKQAAMKAWKRAVKRYQDEHGCDREAARSSLLEHSRRFSASPKAKGEFCPHPATWLNEDRWEDDPATWGNASHSRVASDEDLANWNATDGGLGGES